MWLTYLICSDIDLFKANITHIERIRGTFTEKAYEVRTDKIESKILLFDYLNKFPFTIWL